MKYELIVVWSTGEKESYLYDSLEKAQEIERGYKRAFGSQLWTAINQRAVGR